MSEELSINEALKELKKINLKNQYIDFIQEGIQFNDEPRYFSYAGKISDFSNLSDARLNDSEYCSGLSDNDSKTELITYAEGIERYSLSVYKLKSMIHDKYNNLNDNAVNPNLFINSTQLKDIDFREIKIYWSKVYSYFEDKEVLMPSQLIFVPFEHDRYYIRHPISTGCAVGTSNEMSIFRGICESIERDNFITMYLNKTEPYVINIKSNLENKEILDLISYFKRYLLKVNIYKINPDDNFHTILVIIEDLSKAELTPYLSLGCSCDVDLYSAIKKAIFEAQKSRIWIRQEILLNPKEFLKFKDNMNFTNLVQRGFFWANKKNKKYLDFIFNSKKKYELKSQHKVVKNKFNTIINYLKHNNYSIYVADLRPEFLSKTNIYINKVIIPELQPLYLYENFKYDIGKNLKKKLNKIPHPFL